MKAKVLKVLLAALRRLLKNFLEEPAAQFPPNHLLANAGAAQFPPNHLLANAGAAQFPPNLLLAKAELGYELVGTRARTEEAFLVMQRQILRRCRSYNAKRQGLPAFFVESGRIDPGRRYFYVKPKNAPGWLVEESTNGWVVSRSEKIVGQDLFLRKGEALDIASLFRKRQLPRARVSSSMTRDQIISLSLYGRILERLMVESIQGGVQ